MHHVEVVIAGDPQTFALGKPIPQIEGPLETLGVMRAFIACCAIRYGQIHPGNSEIRIQVQGVPENRDRCDVIALTKLGRAQSVIPKRLEGRCGYMVVIAGRRQFLDGTELLSQFPAHLFRGIRHGVQRVFLVRRLDLRERQSVAGQAIGGFQCDGKRLPDAADDPADHGLLVFPLADFTGHIAGDLGPLRPVHQLKILVNLPIVENLQEWRFLELNGQSFAEHVVKFGVASGVGEIGDDNRILVRELRRPVKIKVAADREQY